MPIIVDKNLNKLMLVNFQINLIFSFNRLNL